MCDTVDAACHSAHDTRAGGGERTGDRGGRAFSVRGGAAGADDRHRRPLEHRDVADDEQEGRRVVQFTQRRRVLPVVEEDEPGPTPIAVRDDPAGVIPKARLSARADRRGERVGRGPEAFGLLAVASRTNAWGERQGERVDAQVRVVGRFPEDARPSGGVRGAGATSRPAAARVRCARRR